MADTDIPDINALLKRERFHRDTAQWDLCRAAFHPDAEETYIDVSWYASITTFTAKLTVAGSKATSTPS